jgi:arginine utilization protein RocB
MADLYTLCFPDEEYKGMEVQHFCQGMQSRRVVVLAGHRALQDAENLKKLFTNCKSPLKDLLRGISAMSYGQQLESWRRAQHKREMQETFVIKPQQAERLVECGLSTRRIKRLYKAADTCDEFDMGLHEMGVNSRPLREMLLFHCVHST